MTCDRCGCETASTIMSYFNTDSLCRDCGARERAHPKFKEAHDRETEECRKGNYNFPGIGLPDDLKPNQRKD